MTDIVERLRDYAQNGNRPSLWPPTMREAADEIKRLREALQAIAIGHGDKVLTQDEMRARAFDALQQEE